MVVEQIVEFVLSGPGPQPGRTCTLKTDYFHYKTKISKEILSELLFIAKNFAGDKVL